MKTEISWCTSELRPPALTSLRTRGHAYTKKIAKINDDKLPCLNLNLVKVRAINRSGFSSKQEIKKLDNSRGKHRNRFDLESDELLELILQVPSLSRPP